MAKLGWDKFIAAHKVGICVFTHAVHCNAPSGLSPSGRKWPTPYGMLNLAFDRALKGDWALMTEKKVIHLILADKGDLGVLRKMFPASFGEGTSPYKTLCKENWSFTYDTSDYAAFARGLGFLPKAEPSR